MRPLLIFCLAGLSACATVEENPWEGLTVDIKPASTSVDCGVFPQPTQVIGDTIVYDNAGINKLEAYRVCSEANGDIVNAHAAQIAQLKIARNALVDAGQAQRNIAQMREQMLADERKHNAFMSVGYWVVIIGLGLAL